MISKHKILRPKMIGRQQGQQDVFEEIEVEARLYDLYNPLERTPRGIYDGISNAECIVIDPQQTKVGVLLADHVVKALRKAAEKLGKENELQIREHVAAKEGELGAPPRKAA
jgi:hypothetical protein